MTEEEKKQRAIINRMSKIIGHTKSIKNMVEDGRDCAEVLVQLAAVKSALNNAGREILKEHLNAVVQEAARDHDPKKIKEIKEMNRIIDTFLK
ncbi:MAG: metal-sensing transcriptional repressor [Lachnospiraceae bacterium]|nr:metal-sensing transcriptional repressor [Lachnospiraceae bacterium]